MITLEMHDQSATLVCRGKDGCGALVSSHAQDVAAHQRWHEEVCTDLPETAEPAQLTALTPQGTVITGNVFSSVPDMPGNTFIH